MSLILYLTKSFALLFLLLNPACGASHNNNFVPEFILRATAQDVSQACITRLSVLLNGTSPGPELRLSPGVTSWIRVYNDIPDQNLTVHWHGLAQAASPFSDGTPQASQWPIPPMHYFDYELHPKAEDAGTYFYHSHVGFQAVSASGPLIVQDAEEPPYSYDDERTFFLSDIFNRSDSNITQGLQANPFAWSGETSNVLVNGYGISAGGDTSGPTCSLPIIDVKPNTRYRFRFIGGTALSLVSLAFQGHSELTVIEADGQYTKPYTTSYLQIGSGQRYSILFKTKAYPENSTYYMQLETRERPTTTRAYALLAYTTAAGNGSTPINSATPASPPLVLPNNTAGFLDYDLQPYQDNKFPHLSEVTRRVTMTVHQIISGSIIWAQNGLPWTDTFPQVPYLVSLYEGIYTDNNGTSPSYTNAIQNGGMDNTTRTFPAKIGEVLEIVIQNTGADNGGLDVHPFHAHGGHFWDLGSGNGTYDIAANEAKLAGTQPVKRDTTMLYRYGKKTTPGANAGWRAWRLRVEEPGVWMIHCHTLQHMIMGMQTVWVFGDTQQIKDIPFPDINAYLTYGGEANGNATHDPEVYPYFETLNPRPPHHSRQDFSSKRPYVHETQRRSTILPPSPKPQYTNPSPSNLHNSHPQPTTNPDLRPPPPHFPNASTPASNSLAHTPNPQLKPQQLSTPSQTPLSSPRICHRSIGNTNARHYS